MITKKETLKECETFGDILKYYRMEKGIKMTSFAENIEMFQENISSIEKGSRKPPSFDRIKVMARALDLNKQERLEFYKWAFVDRLFPEQLENYRVIQETFMELKEIDFESEIYPNLAEIADLVSGISPRQYKTLVGMIRQFLRDN